MKLGIDFGSTYSTISRYDAHSNSVTAITLQEGGAASIPSVVCINKNNKVTCGQGAKDQASKKSVRLFEAFKMLLTERNQTLTRERGYDEIYTPRAVTAMYLESIIRGSLKRYGETEVEDAVICVPEIWGKNVNTLDGRMILRDVLSREIDVPVKHVRVVTEPEAASAYFAYNYEKETGKTFNGHLLLIDYGGGTLDITLTQVTSDGKGNMEIGYREGGGSGENHRDSSGASDIGCAGIAYMQNVVLLAVRDQGLIAPDAAPDYTAPEFVHTVHDLESQLRAPERIEEIEDVFGEYGTFRKMRQIMDEAPMEFVSLEYDGEEVTVTFQHLFAAYLQIVEPVLKREITAINRRVETHIGSDPCKPEAGVRDDFKIALVGGFGSYFLVKSQIAEMYQLDPNPKIDLRTKSINANQQELAISLGAALLAAGRVVLQKTARRSIGLATKNSRGEINRIFYGIKYHQHLEPGKPYFLLSDDAKPDTPENRVTWAALYGNIDSFMIEFSEHLDRGGVMKLKPTILDRLKKLPEDGFWYCGFSLDESDVFSFHVVPHPKYKAGFGKGIVIRLDSYNRMFDLTAVKEVTIKHGI